MKEKKTIYLCACPTALDTNIVHTDLIYNYNIVGNDLNVENFSRLMPSSVDYLIIFENRKKINNSVKHQLNFLHHIFNHIVVVGENHMSILQDYIYIPRQLTNDKLYAILKIIESGLNKPVNYSYKSFCSTAYDILANQGFKPKHKGYKYIVICAYNITNTNGRNNLNFIYNSIAQIYNSSVQAVERCIRFAIDYARRNTAQHFHLDAPQISNKRFIVSLHNLIVQNLMK